MPKNSGGKARVIGEGGLKKLIAKYVQLTLLDGEPLAKKDWRLEKDPYQARYRARWEDEIRKTKTFRGFCCITVLVKH